MCSHNNHHFLEQNIVGVNVAWESFRANAVLSCDLLDAHFLGKNVLLRFWKRSRTFFPRK
jgi:hypothetical protein